MIKFEPIFLEVETSTRVFKTILDEPEMNKQIVEQIDLSTDLQGRKSNVKAKMTDWCMHDKPGFDKLHNILKTLFTSVFLYNHKVDKPYIVDELWGIKYESGDETVAHNHYPSTYSVSYYPKIDGYVPPLLFPEGKYKLEPKEGMLVIFPAWLNHRVPPTKFDGVRYTCSANILVTQGKHYYNLAIDEKVTKKIRDK